MMINTVKDMAKANLLKDGSLMPAAIISAPNQNYVVGLAFNDEESKREILFKLVDMCKEVSAKEVCLIMEAWFRVCKNLEDANYVLNNYDTEAPSTYPESMRKEAIVLSYFNFQTKEKLSKIIPFSRKNEEIIFEEEQDSVPEGFVANLFF